MDLIYEAMMNQDLIVVHEHMKTPTAQLADYILPGDSWLERPSLFDYYEWHSFLRASEKSMEPPGECRGAFEFWSDLAKRMGYGEHFPWENIEAFLDYRLSKSGLSLKNFVANMSFILHLLSSKNMKKLDSQLLLEK